MQIDASAFTLKIADTSEEIEASQRLRYRVFVEEMGATVSISDAEQRLERDQFDPHFDHMILIDERIENPRENVVAVYRLLDQDKAKQSLGFYGQSEYDLTKLLNSSRKTLELGRSCVDPAYRGGVAMQMLWNGLADYVIQNEIKVLFGVASFPGREPNLFSQALSHLHYSYMAPDDIRVTAHPSSFQTMALLKEAEIDRKAAMVQMPPLIKAYLRLGGFVGEGAFIDHEFNTLDVCVLMDTARMSVKHKTKYSREKV